MAGRAALCSRSPGPPSGSSQGSTPATGEPVESGLPPALAAREGGASPGGVLTSPQEGRAPHLRIRPAGPADLPRVLELEQASYSTPWSAGSFRAVMERSSSLLLLAEERGVLAGHAVVWWVDTEAELANLAVAPTHRGRGLGGRLLDRVLADLAGQGIRRVFLEVREGNAPARSLYSSRGFRDVGRRRDYYRHPREDARVLELELDAP
ncbi:MAG: ribosomal-protein-alanine N-acetyltransferase [Gemmatimonadales bacterium]|nr:MAG: ribosomal-protein-alanine N-acetyltransferase [Gemmatimonadales bacterium]